MWNTISPTTSSSGTPEQLAPLNSLAGRGQGRGPSSVHLAQVWGQSRARVVQEAPFHVVWRPGFTSSDPATDSSSGEHTRIRPDLPNDSPRREGLRVVTKNTFLHVVETVEQPRARASSETPSSRIGSSSSSSTTCSVPPLASPREVEGNTTAVLHEPPEPANEDVSAGSGSASGDVPSDDEPSPVTGVLDPLNLPSLGSAEHGRGNCLPCHFWFSATCVKGYNCRFCHLVHAGQKKKRIRPSKRTRERRKELISL